MTAKKISQHYDWEGEAIIELFLETLTECNYHSEVQAIRGTLKTIENNKIQ